MQGIREDTKSSEVLCKICGSPGKSVRYGVFTCYACQSHFRYSYDRLCNIIPCRNGQKCVVVGATRNDCGECRLRKCLDIGMRFYERKYPSTYQGPFRLVNIEELLATVRQAHIDTRNRTDPKLASSSKDNIVTKLSCALSLTSDTIEAIKGVEEFAKRMFIFGKVPEYHHGTLLRKGLFGVLVRLARTLNPTSKTLICWNRTIVKDKPVDEIKVFWNDIFDFAEKLNSLNLSEDEINIFCLSLIINMHSPSPREILISQIYNNLLDCLTYLAQTRRQESSHFLTEMNILLFRIGYLKGRHEKLKSSIKYLEQERRSTIKKVDIIYHDHSYLQTPKRPEDLQGTTSSLTSDDGLRQSEEKPTSCPVNSVQPKDHKQNHTIIKEDSENSSVPSGDTTSAGTSMAATMNEQKDSDS